MLDITKKAKALEEAICEDRCYLFKENREGGLKVINKEC